jgi:DNA-binding Lrp family transcriptional regulator
LLIKYKKVNDVAEKLGVSKSWVSKRLKLLNAGESVKLLVKSGLTRDIEGLYQLSVLEKKIPDKIVSFVDSCIESGCVPQNFRHIKEQLSPPVLNKSLDSNQAEIIDKQQARKIDRPETIIGCTEIINHEDGILLRCQQSNFILPRHVVDMIISHETK